MRVLSLCNQKGGVGKSTSAISIGTCLAMKGRKVLLVDLDAQGSLSLCAGCRVDGSDLTIYEVLKGADVSDAIRPVREGLDLIPADIRLSGSEIELSGIPGRDFLLREALDQIGEKYDVAIVDCPPSLGSLTLIALTASSDVLIPVKADYLAMIGMSQLVETLNVVRKRMNPQLRIAGVLATFFNPRRNLDQQVIENIEKAFPGKLFETKIRQNTALAEAPVIRTNIFDYNKDSTGAIQYEEATRELIEREGF